MYIQLSLFNNSFIESITDIGFEIEDGKIKGIQIDWMDEHVDFIKNVEERNIFFLLGKIELIWMII